MLCVDASIFSKRIWVYEYPSDILPTVRMSSYRPPHRRNVWPDREAEKREAARKAEEEIRKKNEMNETNFPTLSTARPVSALGGNRFAELAQRWAVDDEVDRRMTDYKNAQKAADKRETDEIVAHRVRRRRDARHDEEQDEEELAPLPQAPPQNTLGIEDDIGWTEVKRKTQKPRRELTIEELDERARRQEEDNRDDEFNGHLFESNRHDHDRV